MSDAVCESCKWWVVANVDEAKFGRCHRQPPILIRSDGYTEPGRPKGYYGWPTTASYQFCGEHSNWSLP